MTVMEISMENYEIDDHFESICELMSLEDAEPIEAESEVVEGWLSKYQDLESAEIAILCRYGQMKTLNRENFGSSLDYLSECAKLDHEIMMLEMTIDELYKEWSPSGSNREDFRIGTIFRSGNGRFLCTDVGQRTIVAIRYTPRNPENMDGPPYFLVETVFDEDDIKAVDVLAP